MSRKLISRSPDLLQLQNEGYNLEIRAAFLLVHEVPYLNSNREVKRGTLVTSLNLAADRTLKPDTHVAQFIGEHPCYATGNEIHEIKHNSGKQDLGNGIVIDHSFSAKPKPAEAYDDYYHKVTVYTAMLCGPAQQVDPAAVPTTFSVTRPDDGEASVFKYLDSATSRAGIGAIVQKLEIERVGIVGLGGTGSYVLDLIAKTPVREIHLFDADVFYQHNAFRAPGAPSLEELEEKKSKPAYFEEIYSKMRHGVFAHEVFIGPDNADQLRDLDFVFLCLDRGSSKRVIVAKLEELGIPFIDVGMGVYIEDGSLGGILRLTTSTPETRGQARMRIPFSDGGVDEYNSNIQIADLNALNAALAVIKWKKLLGFYCDLDREHHATYTIDGNTVDNEDRGS